MNEGYDPQIGAGPLKRAIQRHILDPLSVKLLGGEVAAEQKLTVDSYGKKIVFR